MLITEQLVFIACFFLSLGFFAYIYIAYPFWSHMPVMHTPYAWVQKLCSTAGNPIEKIPYRNKYVKTQLYQTLYAEDAKPQFIDIMHCCYLPSDSILCTVDDKKFDTIFSGHVQTPYITICANACIASLPLTIGNKNIYTVSYLASADKEITRQLLSTHIFNCRRKTPEIKSFLYKLYGSSSTGAVPLLTFTTHLYYLDTQVSNKSQLPPVQQIYKNNWSFIYPLIDTINASHKFTTWLSPAALKTRVDAGFLWVFAILEPLSGSVLAAYFLEDAMTLYENLDYGKMGINLVGSYKSAAVSVGDFYKGLLKCIQIVQKQNLDYIMLTVDDVGHNAYLLPMLSPMLIKKTEGSYILINMYFSDDVDRANAFLYGF